MSLPIAVEAGAHSPHHHQQQQQQQPLLSSLSETIPSECDNKPTNRNSQRILFRAILLLAVWGVISTVLSTTSGNLVSQVLSQTRLVPAAGQPNTEQGTVVFVKEPYGYVSVRDDTSKEGPVRYLFTAAFYEYRLPRAVFVNSLHRETLTVEESMELQFRAGARKRPKDWVPTELANNRSVFLDEPYRDKTVDRTFKRSHRKMNTGLVTGILALVLLVVLTNMAGSGSNDDDDDDDETSGYSKNERRKPTTTTTRLLRHTKCGDWVSGIASSTISKRLVRCIRSPLVAFLALAIALVVLIALMVAAANNPARAVALVLRNTAFCGNQCASSSLTSKPTTAVLEIDACIEACVLGTGGRFAMMASDTWFLVVALVVALALISVVASLPNASRYLSKKTNWWSRYCLPLAIQPEQLVSFPRRALPTSHEPNRGGHQQLHKQ